MCNNPRLDFVNMNACIKFGENMSSSSQDIEHKGNFSVKFYQLVLKMLSGNEIVA